MIASVHPMKSGFSSGGLWLISLSFRIETTSVVWIVRRHRGRYQLSEFGFSQNNVREQ